MLKSRNHIYGAGSIEIDDQLSQKSSSNSSLPMLNPKLMSLTTVKRFAKDKKSMEDYPDRMSLMRSGKFLKKDLTFEQLIDQ
jgi:hypothetical protein